MHFRSGTPADAANIAKLHTYSWQKTYRGDFSDHYLDAVAPVERLEVWTKRLADQTTAMQVLLLEEGEELLGFSCVFPEHSVEDGHLLDNLHVYPDHHGKGLGRALMQKAAAVLAQDYPTGELYLWVLTSNTAAIAFYERLGGRPGRKELHHFAEGNTTEALMMSWPVASLAELSVPPLC